MCKIVRVYAEALFWVLLLNWCCGTPVKAQIPVRQDMVRAAQEYAWVHLTPNEKVKALIGDNIVPENFVGVAPGDTIREYSIDPASGVISYTDKRIKLRVGGNRIWYEGMTEGWYYPYDPGFKSCALLKNPKNTLFRWFWEVKPGDVVRAKTGYGIKVDGWPFQNGIHHVPAIPCKAKVAEFIFIDELERPKK